MSTSAAPPGARPLRPPGPFSGMTVVEVGQFVAVPACGQHLADGGARVIKVEPVRGDPYRSLANVIAPGESRHFLTTNRGKEGVAVDLTSRAGRAVFDRLVASSDVLLTNLSPGALRRQRLRWEDVAPHNPRLVYGVISAFGFDGPRADQPGMDVVAQASSGLMWSLASFDADGVPLHSEVPVADYTASLLLLSGVSAALLARERDPEGRGQKVQVSLLGAALGLQNSWFSHLYEHDAWRHEFVSSTLPRLRAEGASPEEVQRARDSSRPDPLHRGGYRVLRTADGYLSVGAFSPGARSRLSGALGLDDPGRAETEASIRAVAEAARRLSSAELLRRLQDLEIPVSPVRHLEELPFDEELEVEQLVADFGHQVVGRYRAAVTPIGLSATPFRPTTGSPTFGAHTRGVLADLGLGDDEVEQLLEEGVVAEGWRPTAAGPGGGAGPRVGADDAR